MKIYLVRHGQTDWNITRKIQGSTDTELNATGLAQAHELAEKLAADGVQYTKVFSSPLKRAATTGRIAAEKLGVPFETVDGLQEMCLGTWEGLQWKQVMEERTDEYNVWRTNRRFLRAPEGESYQDVLERAVPALRKIAAEAEGDVLVVSHGAAIVTIISWLKGLQLRDIGDNFSLGNCETMGVDREELEARWRDPGIRG